MVKAFNRWGWKDDLKSLELHENNNIYLETATYPLTFVYLANDPRSPLYSLILLVNLWNN